MANLKKDSKIQIKRVKTGTDIYMKSGHRIHTDSDILEIGLSSSKRQITWKEGDGYNVLRAIDIDDVVAVVDVYETTEVGIYDE